MFHLLIRDAVRWQLTWSGTSPAYASIGAAATRWFDHRIMASACHLVLGGSLSKELELRHPTGTTLAPTPDLVEVARAFVVLQAARHEADYDPTPFLTRQDALAHVKRARDAFMAWDKAASNDPFVGPYCLLLLVERKHIVARR